MYDTFALLCSFVNSCEVEETPKKETLANLKAYTDNFSKNEKWETNDHIMYNFCYYMS